MPDATYDERLQKALERTKQLLEKEDYGHAIELCQKILAAYPGQTEAAAFLKEAQEKANQRLVEDIFAYAERLVSTADYDLAIEQIQKIFEFDPDHPRAKERIAQIEAMKSGAPADDGALPDPADVLKAASSGAFGIDENDPFALGDDAPPAFAPPKVGPPPEPPKPAKVFEIEDDMSSALVTSDNMHEAVSEFAARVSDGAKSDIVVDEPEESLDFGAGSVPSEGEDSPGFGRDDAAQVESEDDVFGTAGGGGLTPLSSAPASEATDGALLDDAGAPAAGSGLSPEEERHIADLMKKGQAYFERGQCQLAIDTWYQILLVDENHAAALKNIAKAKEELAMQGKKVHLDIPEPVLAEAPGGDGGADDAMAALVEEAKAFLEAGKFEDAVQKCEHILAIEPGHMEANRIVHEASLKIKARERLEAAKKATAAPAVPATVPGSSPFKQGLTISAESRGNRAVLLLAAGVGGLAILGVGAYFLFSSLGKPAPAPPSPPPPVAAKAPEPAPDPEPEPVRAVSSAPTDAEVLAARLKKAEELYAEAQKHFAAKRYQEAADAVRESLVQNPANLDAIEFKEKADLALAAFIEEATRYQSAMTSYRDGNYEDALRHLYRMTEPRFYSETLQKAVRQGVYTMTVDPQVVERYIQHAWYNAGVMALKGANTEVAQKSFNDYLSLRPDDQEARKHLEVAKRYHNRPKDENYRQYVEFLQLRE